METLRDTSNRIIQETLILLVFVVFIFALHPQRQSLITGVTYGALIAILNFRLLELALGRFARQVNPQRFLKRQYFQRLLIYGVAFAMATRKKSLNDVAVVLGFFLPKIAIYWDAWREKHPQSVMRHQ